VKKARLYAKLLEIEDTMHIVVIYLNVVEGIQNGISNKMCFRLFLIVVAHWKMEKLIFCPMERNGI